MPNELSEMKYAYKRGNNPAGERAQYHCSSCDLELLAEQVGYVADGSEYANGEYALCPQCGEENLIDRDEEQEEDLM